MFLWTVVLPFCIRATIATNTILYAGFNLDKWRKMGVKGVHLGNMGYHRGKGALLLKTMHC